jgi:Carboxypeptidase regulatory-like domain
MLPSLTLQTRVAKITVALLIATVAVRAQSGISSAAGVVADQTSTRQGKFVVVSGASVELEQNVKDSPRKFTTTTDKQGVFRFREIPYGDYVLRVSAPNYRSYELKFFVDSDGSAEITVLLFKSAN